MSDDLDPQAAAFLDQIHAAGIPPVAALSVETARALNNDLFVKDKADLPEVAGVRDLAIDGPASQIPIRTYHPDPGQPRPIVMYFHGGGWVLGSCDTHDDICRELATRAGCVVVSVDYRLAPDHPFPAALDDCYAATSWAATYADRIGGDPDRLAVAGDSAGGNLAAGVTLRARDHGTPDLGHQTLLYPAVNPPMLHHTDSYDDNGEGYLLEYDSIRWFYDHYLASDAHARNEYLFPILADDLAGLPPATVITAGFDPLVDEGTDYATRLDADGVPTHHKHFDGMIHAFMSLRQLDRAADALAFTAAGLRETFE